MTARDVGLAVIERMSRRGLRFPSRITPSEAGGDGIALPSYHDPVYDDSEEDLMPVCGAEEMVKILKDARAAEDARRLAVWDEYKRALNQLDDPPDLTAITRDIARGA